MKLTRPASRSNFRQVEKEWQWEFVFWVLHEIGLSDEILQDCLPESGEFLDIGPSEKIKLRSYLEQEAVSIIDDRDGGLKIYVYIADLEEHVMIAEWKKCKFLFREDPSQIEFEKKIYIEVVADIWVSFEEEDE